MTKYFFLLCVARKKKINLKQRKGDRNSDFEILKMRVELSLDLIIVSVPMAHYHMFCPPVILIMKKMVKMFNLGFTRCGIMEK